MGQKVKFNSEASMISQLEMSELHTVLNVIHIYK